jgi:hypothetical protein
MFCDTQALATLKFCVRLIDTVSSPAGPFLTWSENFAAKPESTVFVPSQARTKLAVLPAPLAVTNAF